MSGVQRWFCERGCYHPGPDGQFVTYADHLAALAAERARIRAAVEGLTAGTADEGVLAAVLAVIDGGVA